eukprot:5677106-Amphidinium_carterae.1
MHSNNPSPFHGVQETNPSVATAPRKMNLKTARNAANYSQKCKELKGVLHTADLFCNHTEGLASARMCNYFKRVLSADENPVEPRESC